MKNSTNHFLKWKRFAEARSFPVIPSGEPHFDIDEFHLNFDMFVIDQYNHHKNKIKNGIKRPNGPAAFKAVFTGVNHIIERFFDAPHIETPFLNKAKRTYTRLYASNNITKKAKALEFSHLRNLVNLAKSNREPFVTLTVKVIITAWFAAGRWSCINSIDIPKTTRDFGTGVTASIGPNPDPSGKFSYIYWKNRKHKPGLSYSILPSMDDKDFDPRHNFLDIISTFNRSNSEKLIPKVSKHGKIWIVDPDPNKHCSYQQFLKMFRQVMFMAGNDINVPHCNDQTPTATWSLHCNRRGFVKTARSTAKGGVPLHWEIVTRHGGWKPTSMDTVFDYNDVDASVHAAALHNMYSRVMLSPRQLNMNPLEHHPPLKRQRLEGRLCMVQVGALLLRGVVLLNTLPTGSLYERVRIGSKIDNYPSSSITMMG